AFGLTTSGDYSVHHTFVAGTDGAAPGGILQASDGQFYGTTRAGGAANLGTVFRLSGDGVVDLLHEFTGIYASPPLLPSLVSDFASTLMQASDGAFYGTTLRGGAASAGTLFRISSAGDYAQIDFNIPFRGSEPAAPLIEASDGTLYGTTTIGGSNPSC